MMKHALLAAAAMAAFATAAMADGSFSSGIAAAAGTDCARIEPSKTLELIRRIKDAGGVVVAS